MDSENFGERLAGDRMQSPTTDKGIKEILNIEAIDCNGESLAVHFVHTKHDMSGSRAWQTGIVIYFR
jgi:hypothetical protein